MYMYMSEGRIGIVGPDFECSVPAVEGCPPARPVADLAGPPDDIAFSAPPPETEAGMWQYLRGPCFLLLWPDDFPFSTTATDTETGL